MSGVSYLSSNGIAPLVRYHRQTAEDRRPVPDRGRLRSGQPRAQADRRRPDPPTTTGRRRPMPRVWRPKCDSVEREGMVLQVFPKARGGGLSSASSSSATHHGFPDAGTTRQTSGPGRRFRGRPPSAWAPWVRASRHAAERFGEFLAVAGVAAYRPSAGPGRPDFEHAAGAFVPAVRVLYGLAFPVERAAVVRFEAKGEPGERLRPSEPDRRGLSRPGRRRRGGRRACRRDRRAGRRGAAAVAGRSSRRARPVRPPRGARLALAHARARAYPKHGPGRRRGDPAGGSRARAVRPAALGGKGA